MPSFCGFGRDQAKINVRIPVIYSVSYLGSRRRPGLTGRMCRSATVDLMYVCMYKVRYLVYIYLLLLALNFLFTRIMAAAVQPEREDKTKQIDDAIRYLLWVLIS